MRHPSVRPGAGALGLPAADVDPVVSGSLEAEAVIMGLPFDAGVTGVPGQRHGPEIFRKLSPGHDWSVDDDGALGGLIDPLTGGRCSPAAGCSTSATSAPYRSTPGSAGPRTTGR